MNKATTKSALSMLFRSGKITTPMPSVANSLSPFPTAWHGSISSQLLRCFSTTKYPSRTKMTDERQQQNQKIASGVGSKTNHAETTSGDTRSKESSSTEKVQRFKSTRRKDWKKDYATQRNTTPKAVPVVQPSIYYYCTQPAYPLGVEEQSTDERLSSRFVLPTMNASALLDPLKYCKNSSRLSDDSRGVSRSISGTDAARRLLRGKKDFIVAARALKSQPAVLEGHGVPQKLFQHCIDMADALLLQFSPDVVECTFHNYNYATAYSKLPSLLRVRSRDATNSCSPWPPENTTVEDWDYHLELYLTVMERIACHLGMVLQKKHRTRTQERKNSFPEDVGDDGDELTSSPFLFPNSNMPQWNVDILRGSYFELRKDGPSGAVVKSVPPMPIVEFNKESESTGHVLIRLQGQSTENVDFGDQRSTQPVTLVFDARFPK